jgi:hypothetical protein
MQMLMRRQNHCELIMDQYRMWRTDLGLCDVDRYICMNGNNANADEEKAASQVHDGSSQNLEVSGHSNRECEDWTVYFTPVKYNNGEANATASEVSEAKTVL